MEHFGTLWHDWIRCVLSLHEARPLSLQSLWTILLRDVSPTTTWISDNQQRASVNDRKALCRVLGDQISQWYHLHRWLPQEHQLILWAGLVSWCNFSAVWGWGGWWGITSWIGKVISSGRLTLIPRNVQVRFSSHILSSNRCVGGELSYVKNDKIYPSKPLTITKEPIAQLKDLQFVEKHSLVHQLFWVGPRSIKLQRNKRLGYSLLHRNVKGIQGETVIPPSNRYQFSASLK